MGCFWIENGINGMIKEILSYMGSGNVMIGLINLRVYSFFIEHGSFWQFIKVGLIWVCI